MLYHLHFSNIYNKLPLLPVTLGINHPQEPVVRPNGLSLFQWFYCVRGKGEFITDSETCHVSERESFFIYPDTGHSYHGLTGEWILHVIGFGGRAAKEILHSLQMYESGVYHISEPDIFPEHIQNMLYLSQRELPHRERELSKSCYNMLLDLAPGVHRINTSSLTQEDERIRDLVSYMEENYSRDLSLDELAGHVNLTKEYMCQLFKKNMGQTILHFLQGIRISRARFFLIQYPEKNVWEIAAMCGFSSPSYFGKIFREICGCSPDAFRRK